MKNKNKVPCQRVGIKAAEGIHNGNVMEMIRLVFDFYIDMMIACV